MEKGEKMIKTKECEICGAMGDIDLWRYGKQVACAECTLGELYHNEDFLSKDLEEV